MKSHAELLSKMHHTLGWCICFQLLFGLVMVVGHILHCTVLPPEEVMIPGVGDAYGIIIGVFLLLGAILFRTCQRFCVTLSSIEKALLKEKEEEAAPKS